MPRPKGSKNKSTLIKLGILPAPVPPAPLVDTRTDNEIISEICDRFDVYYSMIVGATQGAITSLIVSGSAGVGKSYTAEWALEVDRGQASNSGIRAKIIRGAISPIDLYSLAYEYRHENNVIVLDDADCIFDDEVGLNLLKCLLDTSTERKVNWMTDHPRFKGVDALPKEFTYRGSMIFLTNKNFQEQIDRVGGRYVEHMQALMSRSIYLDLKMHNRREVALWARYLVLQNNILTAWGLTKAEEEMLMDWLRDNMYDLRELSIRTAIKLAKIFSMNRSEWERIARMCLIR